MYQLLKRLSVKHQITLLSFLRDGKELVYKKDLSFLRNVITYMRGNARQFRYFFKTATSSYPWLWATYDNAHMRKGIETLMSQEKFDLIHVEPGYVMPSIPKTRVPIVVAEHNIEHRIYEDYVHQFPLPFLRPLLYFDVLKMQYWEKKIWQDASHVIAVSQDDKNDIVSKSPVSVVPNGVDTVEFSFVKRVFDKKNIHCLFVGDFRWFPNVDAVKWLLSDIWPKINKNARLTIVGRSIPDQIKKFASAQQVETKESVPNIVEEYQKATVLLAPIRLGGGTKYKVLEAMATGLPVVGTSISFQGLPVVDFEHVVVANTADVYVVGLKKLVSAEAGFHQIANNARALIEKHYTWDTIANQLDNIWRNV